MSSTVAMQAYAALHARLCERRTEIEEAVLTRVQAVSGSSEVSDPEYAAGLRAAVAAAINYGLAGVESGEGTPPPVPANLLVQARLAARNGVSLDTVLRRYFAGYALLGDFLIEECEAGDLLRGAALKRLLRAQAALFDGLLAAVSEEHARDGLSLPSGTEQRRAELVEGLLAGELRDAAALRYDLAGFHCGLVAAGPGSAETLSEIAGAFDRRLLMVRREEETVWAWLGGLRSFDRDELERLFASGRPFGIALAIGEPGQGLAGWRLTHQQARAALPIAQHRPDSFVRYADVALLASILQDDLLVTSLRQLYLAPLSEGRDGGEVLRETLRAYFATGSNVSSAAAVLGVNRHTVTNRLRIAEERIGRPLTSCATEINAALLLENLA